MFFVVGQFTRNRESDGTASANLSFAGNPASITVLFSFFFFLGSILLPSPSYILLVPPSSGSFLDIFDTGTVVMSQ